jgi:hypothetical protein
MRLMGVLPFLPKTQPQIISIRTKFVREPEAGSDTGGQDSQAGKGSLPPGFPVDGEAGGGRLPSFGCWEEKGESGKNLYHGESRNPISTFGQGAATSGKRSESYLTAS